MKVIVCVLLLMLSISWICPFIFSFIFFSSLTLFECWAYAPVHRLISYKQWKIELYSKCFWFVLAALAPSWKQGALDWEFFHCALTLSHCGNALKLVQHQLERNRSSTIENKIGFSLLCFISLYIVCRFCFAVYSDWHLSHIWREPDEMSANEWRYFCIANAVRHIRGPCWMVERMWLNVSLDYTVLNGWRERKKRLRSTLRSANNKLDILHRNWSRLLIVGYVAQFFKHLDCIATVHLLQILWLTMRLKKTTNSFVYLPKSIPNLWSNLQMQNVVNECAIWYRGGW